MTRHIFFVLLCSLTINAQAASPDELCREAWDWVKQEYFQPVDEQTFFAACPASLGTVLAGIWQGYGKALVMGLPSFGKHTIETIRQMQSQPDTYLKLTTAAWTYLDGRSVAGQGLVPDVRFDVETDVPDPSDAIVAEALSKLKVR